MTDQNQPTQKDAVLEEIEKAGVILMPTPVLPESFRLKVGLPDSIVVRIGNNREKFEIIFDEYGDIFCLRFPQGTIGAFPPDITEVGVVTKEDGLPETISSDELFVLLKEIVFPELV